MIEDEMEGTFRKEENAEESQSVSIGSLKKSKGARKKKSTAEERREEESENKKSKEDKKSKDGKETKDDQESKERWERPNWHPNSTIGSADEAEKPLETRKA